MMSVSDWISIICAGVALIVTVIIAVLQIRQSNRMERFEKRQDKRDEQRHQESVKAQAVSFISKYYKDRGLIPLCAIATMYNDLFYYNREMFDDPFERAEEERLELEREELRQCEIRKARIALSMLQPLQRERLMKNVCCGLSSRAIAKQEGVYYSSVDKSIAAAKKNFIKFYKNL